MKINLKSILPYALCVILGAVIFKQHSNPSIPTIVTKYDTVTVTEFKHDTAWLTKLQHDTVYKVNIVEKVITAPPETIHLFHSVSGITGIQAGQKFGDTTKVVSFTLAPKDTTPVPTFLQTKNLYSYYTPGPVEAVYLTANGTPHVTFADKFPVCSPWKERAIGAGGITLLRILLNK